MWWVGGEDDFFDEIGGGGGGGERVKGCAHLLAWVGMGGGRGVCSSSYVFLGVVVRRREEEVVHAWFHVQM